MPEIMTLPSPLRILWLLPAAAIEDFRRSSGEGDVVGGGYA